MIQNKLTCDSTLYKNEAKSSFRMSPQIKNIFLCPGKIIKNFCKGMRRNNTLEHLPECKKQR